MPTDRQSQPSLISRLRQELGMPVNAIIGYSEIILEEIEEINHDFKYLSELEQIRECGIKLLDSISAFLNSVALPNSQVNLQSIFQDSKLRMELEKPTQLVIKHCQQLTLIAEPNFTTELEKINSAANKLLHDIRNLTEIPLEDNLGIKTQVEAEGRIISKVKPRADEVANLNEDMKSGSSLSALKQPKNVLQFAIDPVFQNGEVPLSKSEFILESQVPTEEHHSHILIVDDSITNRKLLASQIEAQNYQVATAANGKQAIQMIQTGIYDLILLDIIMPEIDGYQVLEWIRNSPWQHIPTIMISALDQIDSVVKCIEMGAADYLARPFNSTLLKARLGACLEQKKLRDQKSSYIRQLAKANHKIQKLNNCLQAENTRLTTELEVTQRLQTMLLPKERELNQIEALEIAGFSESAAEVGGDYYDVIQHLGRIIIAIGDVSGHGLESGVLMLMVQTAVRTLIENNEENPKQFFETLNRTIYKNLQRMDSDKNLSLSLVDYYNGMLSISGQHEEMLIVRTGGILERVDTLDLGFPIGLEETIEDFVFQAKIPLERHEVVVLYTDGITEAENCAGLHYGMERLCAVVQRNWQQSAQDIRLAVIQDLRSHIGVEQVYDDITLVVLKRR